MRRPRRKWTQRVDHWPHVMRRRSKLLAQHDIECQRAETGAKLAEKTSP
jgi:hypothetical protein